MGKKNPYKIKLANGLEVKLVVSMSTYFEIEGKTLSKFSRDSMLMENAEEIVAKFSKIWKGKLEVYNEMLDSMANIYRKASHEEKKISKRLYNKIKSCTATMTAERNNAKYICEDLKILYKNCLGKEFEG